SERLILSFPRSGDESDTLPSFYLDEVRAALPGVATEVRALADVMPRFEECVTDRDRLLAGCAAAIDLLTRGADIPEPVKEVLATAALPALPRLGGRDARKSYGQPRRLKVTEIEDYNRCPFQHFMKAGLGMYPEQLG